MWARGVRGVLHISNVWVTLNIRCTASGLVGTNELAQAEGPTFPRRLGHIILAA